MRNTYHAEKPVPEWSKSAVYVARYHIQHGGGDLILARQYLEFVATSNAEEVNQAAELLRRYLPQAIKLRQQQQNAQVRAASEGPPAA